MVLFKKHHNLVGINENAFRVPSNILKYNPHFILNKKGYNELIAVNPFYLQDSLKKYRGYELDDLPEETSWFYVESVSVFLGNAVKGEDTIFSFPLTARKKTSALIHSGIFPPGLTSYNSGETYNTGDIIREKLNFIVRPNTDNWVKTLPKTKRPNTVNIGEGAGDSNTMWYRSPIGNISSLFNERVGLRDYLYPIKVETSLSKIPLHTRHKTINIGSNLGIDTIVPLNPENPRTLYDKLGIQIPIRIQTDKSVNYNTVALPNYLRSQSGREEEEFLLYNENFSEQLRVNSTISLILEAAQLINPFTFGSTIFRMFTRLPNLVTDYVSQKARELDALNNFNGFDMFHLEKVESDLGITEYITDIETSESMTITIPTKRIYYNNYNEKSSKSETSYVELPINKLFKDILDFENYMLSLIPSNDFHLLTYKMKVKPFLQIDEYDKAYELWSRQLDYTEL